jgi:hypothetical protein
LSDGQGSADTRVNQLQPDADAESVAERVERVCRKARANLVGCERVDGCPGLGGAN